MLIWTTNTTGAAHCKEGYRVYRSFVGSNIVYSAWCPLHRRIAQRKSQADAKQACESHYLEKISRVGRAP